MPSSLRATPFVQALFGEGAVVIIAEEQAGCGIASDIDIRPAVVVEIGANDGEAIAGIDLWMPAFSLTSVKVPSPLL